MHKAWNKNKMERERQVFFFFFFYVKGKTIKLLSPNKNKVWGDHCGVREVWYTVREREREGGTETVAHYEF